MGLLSWLFGASKKADTIKDMISRGAVVIDVRSKGEYSGGHVKNAINMPLDTVSQNINKIKGMNKPIILCCASGMRSGSATSILKSKGMTDVINGGSWFSVSKYFNL